MSVLEVYYFTCLFFFYHEKNQINVLIRFHCFAEIVIFQISGQFLFQFTILSFWTGVCQTSLTLFEHSPATMKATLFPMGYYEKKMIKCCLPNILFSPESTFFVQYEYQYDPIHQCGLFVGNIATFL